MPVVLASEDSATWLDPATQDIERRQPLLCPYPPGEMTASPVSTRFNNPSNDTLSALPGWTSLDSYPRALSGARAWPPRGDAVDDRLEVERARPGHLGCPQEQARHILLWVAVGWRAVGSSRRRRGPPSPPVYTEQQPAAPPAYWYYCPDSQTYYPYVKECSPGWLTAVPSSGPPPPPPPR
jgi:SOS response associated peptidase (SRAP)